ncbi:hypothetical protein OB999_03075 [Bacillus cereus]|nr:hypothetical protein [Bacillus cereus]
MKSFQEKTTADNKSIGFDYQYYYFLYLLLNLKEGEQIGIEVKDDVHIDLKNGHQILLQLKHSILTKADGTTANLTELDSDLWKTLYNWTQIVNDKTQRRGTFTKQSDFINMTHFILVSNKSSNQSNTFLKKLSEFKTNTITIKELKGYLEELLEKVKDSTIQEYLGYITKQNMEWLSLFFKKVDFELDEDDLIKKIKGRIREKLVKENRIDDVFESLDSNIRANNYINIKNREKIIITFDDFRRKAEVYFEKARDSRLPIRKKLSTFSGDPFEQTFIKQLLDIEILEEDNLEELLTLISYKLFTYTNLEKWEQEGDITSLQREQFDKNCILQWKNVFNRTHQPIKRRCKKDNGTIDEDTLIDYAQKCYFEILDKTLAFEQTTFDTEFSNGQFYLLSDAPRIGWKLGWEENYK